MRLRGTLYSFAIFALAFVARPIGTVIFTAIDRTYGRGVKLTVALFLLGSSTVAMAFLPGYADIGAGSAVLLGLFRVGQGLALGGAWDGLASLLAMSAPDRQRGWYAMIPQLGAPLGLMVASGLFAYFVANLSADDFFDWGWRYAFFVAFAINVVALFARLRIVVTPEYERQFESRDLEPAPVIETVQSGRPQHRHRRLCPAGELRAVPYGDGVPAVLGVSVHAAIAGALPDHSVDRGRGRRRGHRRFGPAGRPLRPPHAVDA